MKILFWTGYKSGTYLFVVFGSSHIYNLFCSWSLDIKMKNNKMSPFISDAMFRDIVGKINEDII